MPNYYGDRRHYKNTVASSGPGGEAQSCRRQLFRFGFDDNQQYLFLFEFLQCIPDLGQAVREACTQNSGKKKSFGGEMVHNALRYKGVWIFGCKDCSDFWGDGDVLRC